jgi:hypothetical protein
MIDGIMKEERGVALRLLYQLKMSLEKVYPPTDVSVLKKSKLHASHIKMKDIFIIFELSYSKYPVPII